MLFVEKAFSQSSLRRAPEIKGRVWFNAGKYDGPVFKALRGEVILVFFWSSTDSTSLKLVKELNDWYNRYRERGFEIIGVHFSEWTFDYSQSRLSEKIDSLGIEFPIVTDEQFLVRKAYGRLDWPSIFLIDRTGLIRAEYPPRSISNLINIEIMIQALLEERCPDD